MLYLINIAELKHSPTHVPKDVLYLNISFTSKVLRMYRLTGAV